MTHQSCKIGCVYKTPFRKSGHIYIKEGLVFDKHTGSLTGFTDLGDVCNLLAEYEQQQSGGDSTTFVIL